MRPTHTSHAHAGHAATNARLRDFKFAHPADRYAQSESCDAYRVALISTDTRRAMSAFAKSLDAAAPFTSPRTHYHLSSQSYGGEYHDSVGRATYTGASTPDVPFSPSVLNGPPSASYVPFGVGKTRGTNGCTLPPPGTASWGVTRTAHQTMKFTPALPLTLVPPPTA